MIKVGLIAASGTITKPHFERSFERLKSFGFEVIYSDSIFSKLCYYAGDAKSRAKQINDLYANPEVKMIFTIRGGHGLVHAMPFLDFDLIKTNYKPIIGFSDHTILLNYLYTAFGQTHFHGPHMNQKFESYDRSLDFMKKVIFDGNSAKLIFDQSDVLIEGSIKNAPVVGGNLALLIRSIGTPYELDTDGKVIIIEAASKFSAWVYESLFQLLLAGKFDNCKGVIFGMFRNCGNYDQYIDMFTKDHLSKKCIPVIKNQRFGHGKPNYTIPIGGLCSLDTEKLDLSIKHDFKLR